MSLTHNLLSYDNNTETFQNNFLYNQDQTQYGAGIVSKIGSKIGSVGKGLNSGLNAVAHHKDILKFSKRSTTDKVDMAAKMIDQVRHKLQNVIFYFEKVILILSKFKLPLKNARIRTYILIIPRLLILITGLFILFSGIFGVKKSTKVAAYDIVKIFILIITFLFLTFTYTDYDPSKKTSKTKPDTLIIFIRMFILSLPYVYPLLSSFFVLILSVSVLRIDGKISPFFTKIFNLFIFLCLVIFTLVASIFTLFKRDVSDDACLDKNLKHNETASDHCNMYKSKKIFSVLMLYIIWYTIYSALEFIVVDTIHFWLKFFGIMKSNDKPNFIMYIMMGIQLLGTILIGGGLVVLQMIPIPPIVLLNGNIGSAITKFVSLLNDKLDDIVNMVKKYREQRILKKKEQLSSTKLSRFQRLTKSSKQKEAILAKRKENLQQLEDEINKDPSFVKAQQNYDNTKLYNKYNNKDDIDKFINTSQEVIDKQKEYDEINKKYQERLEELKKNPSKELSEEFDKIKKKRNDIYNELQDTKQEIKEKRIEAITDDYKDIDENLNKLKEEKAEKYKKLSIKDKTKYNLGFKSKELTDTNEKIKEQNTQIDDIKLDFNTLLNIKKSIDKDFNNFYKKITELDNKLTQINDKFENKPLLEKNNNLYKLITNFYLNNKSFINKIKDKLNKLFYQIINEKNQDKLTYFKIQLLTDEFANKFETFKNFLENIIDQYEQLLIEKNIKEEYKQNIKIYIKQITTIKDNIYNLFNFE